MRLKTRWMSASACFHQPTIVISEKTFQAVRYRRDVFVQRVCIIILFDCVERHTKVINVGELLPQN